VYFKIRRGLKFVVLLLCLSANTSAADFGNLLKDHPDWWGAIDRVSGVDGRIIVADRGFVVNPRTKIVRENGLPLSISQLKKGQLVKLYYYHLKGQRAVAKRIIVVKELVWAK